MRYLLRYGNYLHSNKDVSSVNIIPSMQVQFFSTQEPLALLNACESFSLLPVDFNRFTIPVFLRSERSFSFGK